MIFICLLSLFFYVSFASPETIADDKQEITQEETIDPNETPALDDDEEIEEIIATSPLQLTGKTVLNLPGGLGKVDSDISAGMVNDIMTFQAKLMNSISFAGIEIQKPLAIFNTKGGFKITGEAEITVPFLKDPLIFIPKLELKTVFDPITNRPKKFLEFRGTLKQDTPFKPFAKTNIPTIKDISLSSVYIGAIATKKPRLFLGGTAEILGLPTNAKLMFGKGGMSMICQLTKGPKALSNKLPMLAPFANALKNTKLIVSTYAYKDSGSGIDVVPGITLSSTIDAKAIPEVKNFLEALPGPQIPSSVVLSGSISPMITQSAFMIRIPMELALVPDKFFINDVNVMIRGIPPVFRFGGKVKLIPSEGAKPLLFSANIRVDVPTQSLGLDGSMIGKWKQPLGLKFLDIEDLALDGLFTLKYIQAAYVPIVIGIPIRVGLTGKTRIGDQEAEITFLVDVKSLWTSAFYGSLNHLSLQDLMRLPKAAGLNIPIEGIPPFEISDVKFSFVPTTAKISDIIKSYPMGFTMRGKIHLFNKYGVIDANLDLQPGKDMGIRIEGMMSKLQIGPLFIGSEKPFTKDNVTYDGPKLRMMLTPKEQELRLDGIASFLKSKGKIDVLFNRKGIHFDSTMSIGHDLKASIEGDSIQKGNSILDVDFKVKGRFEDKAIDKINKEVQEKLSFLGSPLQILNTFRIREIHFDLLLSQIQKSFSAKLRVEFVLFGQNRTLNIPVFLKDPTNIREMVDRMASEIFKEGNVFMNVTQGVGRTIGQTSQAIGKASSAVGEFIGEKTNEITKSLGIKLPWQ